MTVSLRPYQQDAVDRARDAFSRGHRSVLLVLATGAGKGTIAVAIMRRVVELGGRVLFIVHREPIVADVAQRLLKHGVHDLGVRVGGKLEGNPWAPVQVCSIQTLVARADRPFADLLVWDEGHHASAATYRHVREAYPDADHLGLTATPERADGTALGDVFEVMICVSSVRELTNLDVLAPCDVVHPPRQLADGLAEDPVLAYQRWAAGRRCICFAESVATSEALVGEFNAAGIPAALIDGSTPREERHLLFTDFRAGRLLVLVNVYVLTEGIDLPEAEVCLMARAMGSAATYLQCVGRVLRASPASGKSRAMLIDLRGVVHEHGLPDDDRVYSLNGKAIREQEKLVPVRTCLTCGACWRPKTGERACPRCGVMLPLPPRPVVHNVTLMQGGRIVSHGEKREAFDLLCEQARVGGWKPVAVGIEYKKRFGKWPPWGIPGFTQRKAVAR